MSRSTDSIPFARPSLGGEEEEAVLRVMRSGWLTTGAEAQAFETELADYVGVSHAIAVNSATAGLHLALEALGIGEGDRVVLSPYTFTATAEVIRYLGADPLFCDIEEASCNIDPAKLERLCQLERHGASNGTGRIAAVMPVHIGGMPCEMDEIMGLADRYGFKVIEDAAHSFPGRTALGYTGTLGDAGVYSFYATKTITTAEGGMIVTDNDETARRMRLMRLHGIDRDVWNRYTSVGARWDYDVIEAGYKYNLPDLLAAIGRVQLTRAETFLRRRSEIASRYIEAFADRDYLRPPQNSPGHAWHLFLLGLEPERLGIDRDGFMEELHGRGIGTSVHYKPLHMMSYYRDRYALKLDHFPVSLRRYQSILSLPLYPELSDAEVERVVEAVLEVGDAHYRGQTQ